MNIKTLRLNTIGQIYHNFQVTKAIEIKELDCILRELVHIPTGTQVMHIANKDPENLFCLSFRTIPENSNGVAHILEHTVLCGSKKYPVKDPFFAMSRRSLNTFMNALTGSDFTCYPAASQVPADFYNLLEVYLDAVFHPNLQQLSFLQEGHRLEFIDPVNPETPLEHKGIVFNEMKGALASPSARLAEAMNQALYPDLTYGINSGGDPREIPHLTYGELRNFHQTFYQPSRCLFYFYGNFPLEGHLDFIEKHCLQDAKKVNAIPHLSTQPRFSAPKRLEMDYPFSAEEDMHDKTIVAFGWLTCHILNQSDILALSVLEIMMMDTDASPLKMAFLKSGLCKQASVSMDVDISEVPIVIHLKGCRSGSADDLEKILFNTLKQIANEGVGIDDFENALHQLEFYRSEITGNHTPFGLSLFMRSALLQQHGGNPEDGLHIHTLLDEIRKKVLADPNFFRDLIYKYFIHNPHFVRITMLPNPELMQKENEEERKILAEIKKNLSKEQKEHLVTQASELETFQKRQEEEDIDILPKISLKDIPEQPKHYTLTKEDLGALELYHHDTFTNGIVYADLGFDLPDLTEEELPYVRLLTLLMPQLGCGDRNYAETLAYIQAHTGGVGAGLAFNPQVNDSDQFYPTISVRGKALHRKASKLFPLLHDMLKKVDFSDLERLKEVLLKHFTTMQSGFVQNSLRYALNLASRELDRPSKISYYWFGLGYYHFMKKIIDDIENSLKSVASRLEELHAKLFGSSPPHLVLTCNNEIYHQLKQQKLFGLAELEIQPAPKWKGNYPLGKIENQARTVASPVAFTCKILGTTPYVHPDTAALTVAAHLMDNLVLHPRIREQGGAYGSGAICNTLGAHFYFYAYRDPNIASTLKAFEDAVEIIAGGNFDDSDVEEALLEVIQDMDSPVAPGSRGDIAYGWLREGKTPENRLQFRQRLLAVKKEDVIRVLKDQIIPRQKRASTVVFAGKELLEKEKKHLDDSDLPKLIIKSVDED